jgi:hypothetical protein
MLTVTGVAGLMTPWAEVVRTAGCSLALVAGAEEGGAELSAPELSGPWFEAGEFFAALPELLVQAERRSAIAAPPAATIAHPARRDVPGRPVPTRI